MIGTITLSKTMLELVFGIMEFVIEGLAIFRLPDVVFDTVYIEAFVRVIEVSFENVIWLSPNVEAVTVVIISSPVAVMTGTIKYDPLSAYTEYMFRKDEFKYVVERMSV